METEIEFLKRIRQELDTAAEYGEGLAFNISQIKYDVDNRLRSKQKATNLEQSKGHFCYGCNSYFHDSDPNVLEHVGCKGKKSLGICVDGREFGELHPYNLENKNKAELIQIIQRLSQ